MTGVKGRSGGARTGAGRLQRRILLSQEHAEKLALIVGMKRGLDTTATANKTVETWIDNAWTELDMQFQENAEKADE